MPKKPPDLFKFWDELKRRKVVKASLVYIAVAYAIIQGADIIFPRLGLPDWTVTFILILLIIVFILVIVLTWVYDITPEGIKVTQTLESKQEKDENKKQENESDLQKAENGTVQLTDENSLMEKVHTLENQLAEARTISLKKVLPLLIKKLALPVVILVMLLLVVIFKQDIIDLLGFGNAKIKEARTHNASATMYISSGDLGSAKREVELALASNPDYSYAWSNMAVISYKMGDPAKAVIQTVKAMNLDTKNSRAPYNLAYLLDDKNDYKQAEKWYKEAIRIDSTYKADTVYTAASSALGRLYNMENRSIEALLVLNRAKDQFPASKYIYLVYRNLGNSYLLREEADSALKYLELSDRLMPGESATALYLAKAYEVSGQINKSIEQWQNYINLEIDTAKINEALKHRKELAVKQLQDIIK
jgi:tetratricopeptide (TPR) repeat protein